MPLSFAFVAGPSGPSEIRRRRNVGFDVPVIVDGEGYAGNAVPAPGEWASMQRASAADRVLLPGVFAEWEKDELCGMHGLAGLVAEQAVVARDLDAVLLLAIDSRWIAYPTTSVLEVLREAGVPVALVLADPKDPRARSGAVSGFRRQAVCPDAPGLVPRQRHRRMDRSRDGHGLWPRLLRGRRLVAIPR